MYKEVKQIKYMGQELVSESDTPMYKEVKQIKYMWQELVPESDTPMLVSESDTTML